MTNTQFSTKEELKSAFKAGEITSEEFIAELESFTAQELAAKEEQIRQAQEALQQAKNAKTLERTKTLTIFDYVDTVFNKDRDVRVLFDLCELMIRYAADSTGYKASGATIEEKFPGLTFSQVLSGFSALKQPDSRLFPVKKGSKTKHTLNGVEYSTNEYLIQSLIEIASTPSIVTETPVSDDF